MKFEDHDLELKRSLGLRSSNKRGQDKYTSGFAAAHSVGSVPPLES